MTLWSGRLPDPPSDILWSYTVDRTDERLLPFDIEGSMAHAAMLHEVGLLSEEDHRAIHDGLAGLLEEALQGSFTLDPSDEDIHTAVERRLTERIGEPGQRLHTARSRNDQIALDLNLYLRAACAAHQQRLADFVTVVAQRAEEHADTIVAGYTHLQQAQSVSLGHHLLAHAWPALRDWARFGDLSRRLDQSALGAMAMGGTTLPIDPSFTAAELDLETTFLNSIDSVAARDVAAEFVWCCAQAMVSRSRLAEEIVLWSTSEFSWIDLPNDLVTGSSALPHKRNPDIAELVRGRSASVIGDLVAILTLQRSLPLSYNRDLQEDKVHVFRADDVLASSTVALTEVLRSATFHPPPPMAEVGSITLAEHLVARGTPFRAAYGAVGALMVHLHASGRPFAEVTDADLQASSDLFEPGDADVARRAAVAEPAEAASMASVLRQIEELQSLLADGDPSE